MAPHTSRHLFPIRFFFNFQSKSPFKTLPISPFSSYQATPTKKKTFSHIFQECSDRKALCPGKQAHARMILTEFKPTVFVTNCLIQMYIKCSDLEFAFKVFDGMPQRDTVSWNAMLFGYAGRGDIGVAQKLFDAMPERDVVSWNSLISGYLHNGDHRKVIDVFLQMGRMGTVFDRTTFAVVLKSCSSLEDHGGGIQIHGLAVKMGFDCDVVTGSALLDMYAKCKKLDCSIQFFHSMPEKNWVSWSAIIAGCVQNDDLRGGLELFKEMQKAGVGVSQSTFASVFRSCAGLSALRLGSQLHGHALKTDFGTDVVIGTATLDMYMKCNNLSDAQKLFNSLPNHNLQSYNAIIVGYARSDKGLGLDEVSLSGAFRACAVIKGDLEGLQVHGLSMKSLCQSNICVANAILDMYGKCGALVEACLVFEEMVSRDAVSWNAIIAAHEQNGNEEKTLSLFIHNRIIKSRLGLDSFVGIALIDMYSKCGMMEKAEKLHDRLAEQTVVSWNAIISGFSLQKQSEEAQKTFSKMLEMGVDPDNFTYATILDTCANLVTVELGKQIHAQIIKKELQSDAYISSTLVDMYSKCGNMQDFQLIFEKAPNRDFVTWNAMVCGYAQHGLGEEALKIFEYMQLENVKPNHATFLAVLRACGHMGLVEKGLHYFHSMLSNYGLDPQLEHYSCVVDIMGRSGQVSKALELIEGMPFEADAVIWRTLLSICKIHGNVEVAEKAAYSILQLEPEDSAAYVLLSNIYANAGMWNEVTKLRKMMRFNGLKKEPGCSWIEIKSEVHAFLVGDKAHPRSKEIYENLDVLTDEMKWVGYMPDTDFILNDDELRSLQNQILICYVNEVVNH
ncbi:unnamed protein product, partial [Vitis vinifera]